ncbi:aaa-domain-containing protein [Phaffia rhodozyma]|uniref:Aaa-domain-containing protein n=1 Tax=Phaffia rhodozyma TaxID=264483 RepID=A0A0F7SM93_PHARH|nr:aaa-domain-containing protein [Phaffia rhodozyma]
MLPCRVSRRTILAQIRSGLPSSRRSFSSSPLVAFPRTNITKSSTPSKPKNNPSRPSANSIKRLLSMTSSMGFSLSKSLSLSLKGYNPHVYVTAPSSRTLEGRYSSDPDFMPECYAPVSEDEPSTLNLPKVPKHISIAYDAIPTHANLSVLKAAILESMYYAQRNSADSDEGRVEPVIGCYCPIDGGGYVVTAAVEEVAAQIEAEVVFLDAIDLCSEGHGDGLGTGMAIMPLDSNPFKLMSASPPAPPSSTASRESLHTEIDLDAFRSHLDDEENALSTQATRFEPSIPSCDPVGDLGVASSELTFSNSRSQSTDMIVSPSNSFSPYSVLELPQAVQMLFESLVRSQVSKPPSVDSKASAKEPVKPRIIYIQNAEILKNTYDFGGTRNSKDQRSSWFHALADAVHSFRNDTAPATIVLGLGPSVLNSAPSKRPSNHSWPQLPEEFNEYPRETPIQRLNMSRDQMTNVVPEGEEEGLRTAVLQKRMEKVTIGAWGDLIPGFVDPSSSTTPLAPIEFPLFPGMDRLPEEGVAFRINLSGLGGLGGDSPFFPSDERGRKLGSKKGRGKSKHGVWRVVNVLPTKVNRKRETHQRESIRFKINEILFKLGAVASKANLTGSIEELQPMADLFASKDSIQEELIHTPHHLFQPPALAFQERAANAAKFINRFIKQTKQTIIPWDNVVAYSGIAAGASIDHKSLKRQPPTKPTSSKRSESSSSTRSSIEDRLSLNELTYGWKDVLKAVIARSDHQGQAEAFREFMHKVAAHQTSSLDEYLYYFPTGKEASPQYGIKEVTDNAIENETRHGSARPVKEVEENVDASVKGSKTNPKLPVEGLREVKDAKDGKDYVIEALKRDSSLNKYEKRILPTIVDPKLVKETFDDVHLPEKTIDAIRSVVSLPLLFPEAFSTGILKNHSSSGALLFGPPGTGKTLLVRALAKASGARMMSIQPSDVMDMYVGEAEKLVKAVFTVARKLSPCIVFIDELDALFQTRTGSAGTGDNSRRQVLTEFMQEMDGLSSASLNKDTRLVVIGATNRPQDLDEAVLRRLPRRLLIDLPGLKEREAILKILCKTEELAPDVDLAKLAKDTDTYSGSDLKHLCVMAAQEAVKELYVLPWAKPQNANEGSAKNESGLTSNSTASDSSSSVTNTPKLSTSETSSGTSTSSISSKPENQASQCSLDPSDQETPLVTTEGSPEDVLRQKEIPTWKNPPKEDLEGLKVLPKDSGSRMSTTATKEGKTAKKEIKKRVLMARHFEYALKNTSSSGSEEMGSLPQLRKWNEEFGEAGTKKNKKSGFGKGFGFGEKTPKESE